MAIELDRVFYDLQLETKGWSAAVANTERSASKLAAFIKKHPIAAVATLTAGFVALAAESARMAGDVEKNVQRAANAIPGMQGRVHALTQELIDMARQGQTTFSPEALAAGLDQIGRNGVANADDAMRMLRAGMEAAEATGSDLITTLDGLDQVMDAFRIPGEKADEVLAKLVATAQGKIPLEDLFAVMQKAAPTLNALHVSLDQATVGITALVDAGVPARQASSGFTEVLQKLTTATAAQRAEAKRFGIDLSEAGVRTKGLAATLKDLWDKTGGNTAALKDLGFETQQLQVVQTLATQANAEFAKGTIDAGKALDDMRAKAALSRSTAEGLSQTLHQQLRAQMMDLGNQALPLVEKGLEGISSALALLNGTAKNVSQNAALITIDSISQAIESLKPEAKAQALRDLRDAMNDLVSHSGDELQRKLAADAIAGLSDAQLDRMRAAYKLLVQFHDALKLSEYETAGAFTNLQALNSAWLTRHPGSFLGGYGAATAPPAAGSGAGAGSSALTDDQQALLDRAHEYLASLTATIADDLQRQLDKIQQQLDQQFKDKPIPAGIQQWLDGIKAQIADANVLEPLERQMEALDQQAQRAELDATGHTPGVTLEQIDALIARTKAARVTTEADQKKLNQLLMQELGMRQQIVAAQQALVEESKREIAASTTTQVDDLEAQIADRVKAVEKANQQLTASQRRALESISASTSDAGLRVIADLTQLDVSILTRLRDMRGQVETVKILEPLESALEELPGKVDAAMQQMEAGITAHAYAIFQKLQVLAQAAQLAVDSATTDDDRKRALDDLKRIQDLMARIAGAAADASKGSAAGAKSDQDRAAHLKAMARNIEQGARGALQLAAAFGLVDERTAATLTNLAQIASGIVDLSGALNSADKFSAGLSIAGAVASLVTTLTGTTAEQERLREELAKNRDAVVTLTKHVGDLGRVDASGTDYTRYEDILSKVIARGQGSMMYQLPAMTKSELLAQGVDLQQLQQIAQQLGIAFDAANPSFEALQQLLDAMKASEIAQFAQSFTGQLQALQDQFKLFDITDPIQQLKQLVDLFSSPQFGAPALRQALAGLDLSTPEGRAAAKQAIQQLFTMLQAGAFTGHEDQLGGMSGQQFLDALLQINDLLSQVTTTSTSSGQTSQFNVDRTITEVTGSRMAALLTTGNAWLEEIAAATAEAAELLRNSIPRGASIQPPSLSSLDRFGSAGSGPVSITIEQLVVHANTSDPDVLVRQLADRLERELSQRFGAAVRSQRAANGTVMLS